MKKYTHPTLVAALSFTACTFLTSPNSIAVPQRFPITSHSGPDEGFYLRLENGVSTISGADVKINGLIYPGNHKLKVDSGYVYGGAVGYNFNTSLSGEVELDNTSNKVNTLDGVSPSNSQLGSVLGSNITIKQTNLLASGVFHYPLAPNTLFNLALGVGAQFTSTNLPGGTSTLLIPNIGILNVTGTPKSDVAFVAQLKTGISIALNDSLSFDAGYKLRVVGSSEFYSATEPEYTAPETASLSSRLNHLITAGLTYRF